ncbi:DNA polymerase IV [Granulosicoccus antarcticus]|uniref:DNA polymerase IV n=1 Tax=Granulosicoccus antarcticus IMCC3135 TaxID=1192854 RepID=A0A2Z2P7X5_9GAMM|nr:DNA polymerase IV [Granulosicoccus antarcticus]ASJ75944.1 DNA polymerase IV [Granulosicoccus antarcticus IMCC3135]
MSMSSNSTSKTDPVSDVQSLRKIIHVDMDAFYASVEQRDDISLRGLPVIVGGQPNGRGVVAACSYEARKFGIHSAMPSAEAGRRCPHAMFVKPRFEVYKQVSQQIHTVFREFTDQIEPLSLDEAYLDVTSNTLFAGSAYRLAREIKTLIHERTGLVASAGVSYNKFLAKIASDYKKPDGLFCILPAEGETFVASLEIGRFHGVGKVTEARMHDLGILTGGDLRQWSEAELAHEFGKSSRYYYQVARGIDDRPVRVSRIRKSMGSERTFGDNLHERTEMLDILVTLLDDLIDQLAAKSLSSKTVTVKVRFADFSTFTRAHTQHKGLLDKGSAHRALPFLLDRALSLGQESGMQRHGRVGRRSGVRLLGVAFSGLAPLGEDSPIQLEMRW